METCPTSSLITHGRDVGLPTGQMGNSEVGHTNIGAGRVVAMDLGQIDLAIEDGSFYDNAALVQFIADLKTCLLYTSPSPRDGLLSRMPSSA